MSRRLANAHPEDVRANVRKRGVTLTSLAERHGLHVSALSHSLRRCIPAANAAIADILQVPVSTIWPEWFDADGQRIRGRKASRPASSTAIPTRKPNDVSTAPARPIRDAKIGTGGRA